MRIRQAVPGEGALIAEEFWYPLAEEMTEYSALNELTPDALDSAADGFEHMLAADDRRIFLLEVEGTPAGFLNVVLGEHPTRVRGAYAEVTDLYVAEGFRNRGNGTGLLEKAEAVAAAEGCDSVEISAEWANEGARRLYERLDYDPKQVTYAKRLE